jgi:hypothetical protein
MITTPVCRRAWSGKSCHLFAYPVVCVPDHFVSGCDERSPPRSWRYEVARNQPSSLWGKVLVCLPETLDLITGRCRTNPRPFEALEGRQGSARVIMSNSLLVLDR